MFKYYQLIENIMKSDMTHVKLYEVDFISKNIINNNIKLKLGTLLEDEYNNMFRVNGYFGNYLILRSTKHHTHPLGKYLIEKIKL